MSASQSLQFNIQEFTALGVPLVGGRIYTYAYGTTTQKTAYTDQAGTISHTYTSDGLGGQYIALNSRGELPAPLYLTTGSYDIALKDSTGATVWTRRADVLSDLLTTQAEWIPGPTPTYVSATSFSLSGNQTSDFHVGRRVRTMNSAGYIYSTISVSSFASVTTTITVVNDSGTLDSGISSVDYGLLSYTHQAIPAVVNIAGGAAGSVPYQSAAGVTAMLAAGTDGMHLRSNGASAPAWEFKSNRIQPIDYSLAANALTVKLNPTTLDFRSTTLTSGTITTVSNASQITMTVSSGSTLGTVNGVQSDIYILALNNAGTIELAVINSSGGIDLSEQGLISTTAEGGAGAADSATVVYSTTARSNVAYRVVGLFRSTQTTAGTWAQTPTLVQGAGGEALTVMSSIGYGQTWQDVTGSRSSGVTYYNTTGKPIVFSVFLSNGSYFTLNVGGVSIGPVYSGSGTTASAPVIIPIGSSYSFTWSSPNTISIAELR